MTVTLSAGSRMRSECQRSVLRLVHHLDQTSDGLEQGTGLVNRDLAACERLWTAQRLEGVGILLAIEGERAGAGEGLGCELLKIGGSDLLRELGDRSWI